MPPVLTAILRLLPTNPIVLRIVQGGSRRQRHVLIRGGFLGGLIVVLLFGMVGPTGSIREIAQNGANAFTVVAYGQVLFICLLTPIFMAGAIAQEAEPKTWEILLSTPLSGTQIVLGNLFGRLFFVAALVISAFGLFAVLQSLGGVPPSAIIACDGIALATALLLGSIAIALSLTRFAGRKAVLVFYASVVGSLVLTYAADLVLRTPLGVGSSASATTILTPLNPLLALESVLQSSSYSPREAVESVWIVRAWLESPAMMYGLLCVLASVTLIGCSLVWVRTAGQSQLGSLGRTRSAQIRAARHVGTNPIAWRELHLRGQQLGVVIARWTFVSIGCIVALIPPILHLRGSIDAATLQLAVAAIVGAETVIVVLIALNTAGTAVTSEREDGSLDILLTTPIQPGAYLGGKLVGLIRYLIPLALVPTLTLAISALYVLVDGLGEGSGAVSVTMATTAQGVLVVPAILPESMIEFPLVLLAFLSVTVMTGLTMSVRSRGTIASVLFAGFIVVGLGSLLGLCGSGMSSLSSLVGGFAAPFTPVTLLLASVRPEQFLLQTATDQSHIQSARWSLAIGTTVAVAAYIGVTWSMHLALRKQFMFTVRRLAGQA